MVIDGIKTATCFGHILYDLENKPLPVAIISTIEVTGTPINTVNENLAITESEENLTYNYWRNTHIQFFTKELNELSLSFSENILLVCERFKPIDVKK